MYNYLEEMIEDIKEYIGENVNAADYSSRQELEEKLYDELWVEDSVTGNASGSYTFNSYQAEENLVGNFELLHKALEDFGQTDADILAKGAEWCDVTIRCYLLSQALSTALDEIEDDLEFAE